MMTSVYLSLGSNMGDRLAQLQEAVNLLNQDDQIEITKVSDVYQTSPVGGVKQDDFYNIAVQLRTTMDAQPLLDLIHQIEQQLHRVRKVHWGPRTLDIDIILFGDQNINTPTLKVPHPEMKNRKFVLEPIMMIYDGDQKPFQKQIDQIQGQEIESIGSLIRL